MATFRLFIGALTAGDAPVEPAAPADTPATYGGGWDARQFARLRRQLARKKRKLCEEVTEVIAQAEPVAAAVEVDGGPNPYAPILAAMRAQLAQIERAATMAALQAVEARIEALVQRIEDEIDEEDTLLLLAA